MNKYSKEFFHRGLIFGGFGPIILSIVYFILQLSLESFSLSGTEVLLGTVSIYILAFIHAGISVFIQIDHWSTAKSLGVHFSLLYVAYAICYLVNSWIPFSWEGFLIFTAIFVVGYLAIWLTVYFIIKSVEKKLTRNIKKS